MSLRLPPAALHRPRRGAAPWLVLAGHGLLLWGVLQWGLVQRLVRPAEPLSVQIVDSPAPAPEPQPARLAAPQQALPVVALPVIPPIEVTRPTPPEPTITVAAPSARPVEAPPSTAPVVASASPTPAPLAAPLKVAASQLRYRVEPPAEVPRLSRRLGESGTVLVRVVVDLQGQPREVSLARSSGYARLDDAALAAMRQARFQPCLADGRPVECQADAPIVF